MIYILIPFILLALIYIYLGYKVSQDDIESLKNIVGFVGFSISGSGIWYALFDIDCAFWKFLNRNAMSRSFEPPMGPVGEYSYRNSVKLNELVSWLLEEYKTYITQPTPDKPKEDIDGRRQLY